MAELLTQTRLRSVQRKKRKIKKNANIKQDFNTNFVEVFNVEKKQKDLKDVKAYDADEDLSFCLKYKNEMMENNYED